MRGRRDDVGGTKGWFSRSLRVMGLCGHVSRRGQGVGEVCLECANERSLTNTSRHHAYEATTFPFVCVDYIYLVRLLYMLYVL